MLPKTDGIVCACMSVLHKTFTRSGGTARAATTPPQLPSQSVVISRAFSCLGVHVERAALQSNMQTTSQSLHCGGAVAVVVDLASSLHCVHFNLIAIFDSALFLHISMQSFI